jgi:hypothetical protein
LMDLLRSQGKYFEGWYHDVNSSHLHDNY